MGTATDLYTASMKSFCKREFGTEDLGECRIKMKEAYKGVWPPPPRK